MASHDSLWEFLAGAAALHSGSPAVTDASGTWTYHELATQAAAVGAWLRQRGVNAGDRVVLTAHSSRHVVAMVYGCARVGATAVPLNASMKDFHRDHVIHETGSTLVVDHATEVWPEVERAAGKGLPDLPAPTDPALLLYTSGSTSMPKAVVCPPASVCFAAQAIQGQLRYLPGDIVYCGIPLSFDYGLYQAFLCALSGAHLVLAAPGGQARILTEIKESGATVVPLVPPIAAMLVRLAARRGGTHRVRLFTNTGEHLPTESIALLRTWFPGAIVQLMYGTTECKRITIMEADGDQERKDCVGRPLPGTEVRVVDDRGEPVSPGVTGEILVRGPHVMAGYWRDPELTSRIFRHDADGSVTLHTGDYGHLDTDGYLYYAGRRDNLFKRNGTRTSSAEIEAAARDVPGVADVVVLPPTDDRDAALCFVGSIEADRLGSELLDRLEPNKVPGLIRRFDSFPLTPNSKVDRREIAASVLEAEA